jgi:iron complex outermembrane receptor protein
MPHAHRPGRAALLLAASSAGLLFGLAATPAAAADKTAAKIDETQVGEIVVTARKRAEALRDVPVAASVVDASQIADRGGLQGVRDLVTALPSVALGDTSTPLTSEISIRGSGTSRGTNADAGVGLYRNGAYIGGGAQGGRTFSRFDLFDAAQIEVLRGNQGALYGRDAVGGAINIHSARPGPTTSGYLSVKGGNLDYVEFEGVVNQPLGDGLSLRLSADVMRQPKGFYAEPTIDSYVDSQNGEGYRAQLRYQNDRLDANLMLEHSKNKYPALNLQLWLQPTAVYPQGVFIEPKFVRHDNFPNNDTDQVNDVEFSASYRFDFATLTSITLYRDRKTEQQFDNDLLDQALLNEIIAQGLIAKGAALPEINGTQQNHGETKSFNQELYLAGQVGKRLNWLAGAEYVSLDDADTITATRTPTKANPSAGTVRPSSQTLRSWAVYGSLGYDVTEALGITGELRYTNDEKHFTGSTLDLTSGLVTAGSVVDDGTNPSNLSWGLTGAYKWSGWMAYAKVGTAFRAGGFNANLGPANQPIPIPPAYGNENATSYEVGAKGNLTPDIYVNGAAYWTEVDNLIIQTDNGCRATNPACPQQQTNFATNGGQAHVWGVELEVTGRFEVAGGQLSGTIGGSRQEGKITSGQFNGAMPPQLPEWLASSNVTYTHPFAGMIAFGNLVYMGRWGGVQEIAQTPSLASYQLVNLRAGVRTGPWELAAYVKNVADFTYLQFSAAGARRWSQPRTYGAQLTFRW